MSSVITPDSIHCLHPKIKAWAYFLINNVVLCPKAYVHHDKLGRDSLMKYSTYFFDLIPTV